MTSLPSSDCPTEDSSQSPNTDRGPILLTALMFLGVAWLLSTDGPKFWERSLSLLPAAPVIESVPLEMQGGDPYVRALMRTISAAESNTGDPYHTLYGGQRIEDLSEHPDLCVVIEAGPNFGDCTTAAGRYQFLTTTWFEKADRYHPHPPRWYAWWRDYRFDPIYQDEVVYAWLSDSAAWGANIPEMLRQNRLDEVLYILSGTWTSLGYGIEDNTVTPYLTDIYYTMLDEELQRSP